VYFDLSIAIVILNVKFDVVTVVRCFVSIRCVLWFCGIRTLLIEQNSRHFLMLRIEQSGLIIPWRDQIELSSKRYLVQNNGQTKNVYEFVVSN